MNIETEVSAFVVRKDMIIPAKTLVAANKEAKDCAWMRISADPRAKHWLCQHGDKAYIVSTDGDKIGCSCPAMAFHCKSSDVCKHIAMLTSMQDLPQDPITDTIAQELIQAGWSGDKGNLKPPEIPPDEDGEDNEGTDPLPPEADKPEPPAKIAVTCPHCMKQAIRNTQAEADAWLEDHPCKEGPRKKKVGSSPEAPPLGAKVYSRTCQHCDQRFEGGDLDDVKQQHRDHIKDCPKNPTNAPKQPPTPVGSKTETTETEKEKTNMKEEPTPETNEEELIEEPSVDKPTKTYHHPDGHEFKSAEALLDYADKQKAVTTTATNTTIDPHTFIAPMIRNLGTPQLTEAGGIRIGRKKGRGTETFDHFIFTLPEKDPATGDFYRDMKMEALYGDNCTELPVRLLSDNITDCFTTFYAKYGSGGIKIRGDGVNWVVTNPDGSKTYIEDPEGKHGFRKDPDVTPQGILSVLVDGQNSVGTVYRFRTSGWNSIKGMLASLSLCSEVAKRAGGRIAFLPMSLVYRTKEVTPKGERFKKKIPVITIEFRGTVEELQERSRDATKYLSAAPADMMQLNTYDPDAETLEEQKDVAAEFYPESD